MLVNYTKISYFSLEKFGKNYFYILPANNPNVIAVSAIGNSDDKCGGTVLARFWKG